MKRVFTMFLVCLMIASIVLMAAGCQPKSNAGDAVPAGSTENNNAAPAKKEVVKIICPYGVGGTADAIARKYAKVAGSLYPEYEFVVEQKTGGDGFVGAAYFQGIDPKSKELFMLGYGVCYRHEIGKQFGTEQVPFDLESMVPLAAMDDRTWILYGKPGTTLAEVLKKAKAGSLKMSGGNPLSDPHLALGSLVAMEGGKVTVVGYDGGAAQKQGLINGEVDVFVGTTQAGMEEVEVGKLIPILAFSDKVYQGFVDPNGPISVPSLLESKHEDLDVNKDYTGSILPAGGFMAARKGADVAWEDKVIEISKAVWNTPEYSDWIKEIGLNRFEVYGADANKFLDEAIAKAINAFKLLSGK